VRIYFQKHLTKNKMWKVALPEFTNAHLELKTALTYADGSPKYELSAAEKVRIGEIYDEYESQKGVSKESLKGTDLSDDTLSALYSAYSEVQEANRLSSLRARILLNVLCPCCGISMSDEIDHHLPRSIFQTLSIYSSNLVPICHKCNNKKRTVTGENPFERFIHVYYDTVPDKKQFLNAEVSIKEDKLLIKYFVSKIPELSDLIYQQLAFQSKRVNLDKRLNKETNVFMLSFFFGMKEAFDKKGSKAVKAFLKSNAKTFQKNLGLNSWRTVLLLSLSNNDEFCGGKFLDVLGYK
jgi:hypothetical protein